MHHCCRAACGPAIIAPALPRQLLQPRQHFPFPLLLSRHPQPYLHRPLSDHRWPRHLPLPDGTSACHLPLPDAHSTHRLPLPNATSARHLPLPDAHSTRRLPLPDATFASSSFPCPDANSVVVLSCPYTTSSPVVPLLPCPTFPLFPLSTTIAPPFQQPQTHPTSLLPAQTAAPLHRLTANVTTLSHQRRHQTPSLAATKPSSSVQPSCPSSTKPVSIVPLSPTLLSPTSAPHPRTAQVRRPPRTIAPRARSLRSPRVP